MSEIRYGEGDATHRALGGVDGIRALVEVFYEEMDRLPEARAIRRMHPSDLTISIDKLARFLSGWTGGPKRYAEKYGSIKIPMAHRHLSVDEPERDAWLLCMERALERLDYPESLRTYLLRELFVPAERIRVVSTERRRGATERPRKGLSIDRDPRPSAGVANGEDRR